MSGLAIDGNSGKVHGAPYRITNSQAPLFTRGYRRRQQLLFDSPRNGSGRSGGVI